MHLCTCKALGLKLAGILNYLVGQYLIYFIALLLTTRFTQYCCVIISAVQYTCMKDVKLDSRIV